MEKNGYLVVDGNPLKIVDSNKNFIYLEGRRSIARKEAENCRYEPPVKRSKRKKDEQLTLF